MRNLLLSIFAALCLAAAAPSPTASDSIDVIAREYVVLALAAKQIEPDWIEAPEVQKELRAEAEIAKLDAPTIIDRVGRLVDRLDKIAVPSDRLLAERHEWLRANLVSLRMQLEAKSGTKLPLREEVRLRYGFQPDFEPLSSYDPILERLDKQLPGSGSLSDRIARMRQATIVPADRVLAVQEAALAECRRRAAQHVRIPTGETVEVRWVENSLYPGGNTFKGNGHSVTEFSSDYKWELDQLLWVTCHEIYPGHHVHFATQSAELFHKRGWPEFSISQNYGPTIPGAEAIAEYGVGLTFPIEDRIRFERDVLYPLAGLKMANPDAWRAFWTARFDMLGASASVAAAYLDGKLNKEQATQAFIKYRMMTPDGASKILPMIDQDGSYVIASDVGWMTIDRRLRGRSLSDRWQAFQRVLQEPMTVADLQKL
jgi:hypothetical protein